MSNTFDKLSVLSSFIEEVNSYLPDIEANLSRLAQSPDDMEALEETHRRTHTIGGSASMMDFPGLAHVAQGMEDILGDALDGLAPLTPPAVGLLQRSFGRMHYLLRGIREGVNEHAVIAEDDADYMRYQAEVNALQGATSNIDNAASNGQTVSANGSAPANMSQAGEMPVSSTTPSSLNSSMPSLDEVLASFRTPSVTEGEDLAWPEAPVELESFTEAEEPVELESFAEDEEPVELESFAEDEEPVELESFAEDEEPVAVESITEDEDADRTITFPPAQPTMPQVPQVSPPVSAGPSALEMLVASTRPLVSPEIPPAQAEKAEQAAPEPPPSVLPEVKREEVKA